MQAIILEKGKLHLRECKKPAPGEGEVLIKVAYAGINRIDVFQREGKYPPPENEQQIPGMEVSGAICAVGPHVKHFAIGDSVCALIKDGGFAEYVAVHEAAVLPIPEKSTMEEAAALPESCFTVWTNLVWDGQLKKGESFLVHGGTSGIGVIAIQIAKFMGAKIFTTSGSDKKKAICKKLGATCAINYQKEDFVKVIHESTHGKGVDVILDMVGGDYFARNLASLNRGGRLCIIAFLKGSKISANLSPLLLKNIHVVGTTLRSRSLKEKAQISKELQKHIWPEIEKGSIKPLIDKIFPLKNAEKALDHMQQGLNIGKILLKM